MTVAPYVTKDALFSIGQIVQHRLFDFRGVIIDVDPEFNNTEEWWLAIPEAIRPAKEQPYYHLLAENQESSYEAYVSQQNLLADESEEPITHPDVDELFGHLSQGKYQLKSINAH